jgi:hypothetical protein
MYEILTHSRDDDSYMYSYSSFSFHVCSTEFGDELCDFSGSHDGDSSGWRKSGTQDVKIEGNFVVATDAEGSERRVELPVQLALAEDGKKLQLTWADGRVELRDRNECLVFGKFGGVFSMKNLVGKPA